MPLSPTQAQAARDRLVQRLAGSAPDHRPENWRIGAGLAAQASAELIRLMPPSPRHAAVLVGLTSQMGEPGILLTVRAEYLRQHAGQIAFPGGSIEPMDDGPAAAALREAEEEVGLPRSVARLVGFLPDQIVLTGFRITPVVAHITADFEPRYDPAEVQGSFVLPWSSLLDAATHHDSLRRIGGLDLTVRDIHFGAHRIWGATAGILLALRELARE
jgi:8-oxo-dGTP pyrophosphatase MutT (NUDIX family)